MAKLGHALSGRAVRRASRRIFAWSCGTTETAMSPCTAGPSDPPPRQTSSACAQADGGKVVRRWAVGLVIVFGTIASVVVAAGQSRSMIWDPPAIRVFPEHDKVARSPELVAG